MLAVSANNLQPNDVFLFCTPVGCAVYKVLEARLLDFLVEYVTPQAYFKFTRKPGDKNIVKRSDKVIIFGKENPYG